MTPLIRYTTLAVPPIALLISLTHLVGADRGPGDGFTAGIISSLGLTLQYISFGYAEARRMFQRMRFEHVMILGLIVALVAAVLPLFVGEPVFGAQKVTFQVPLIGQVRLSQTLLFDLGIYLVVLGGTMTAIDSLGRASR